MKGRLLLNDVGFERSVDAFTSKFEVNSSIHPHNGTNFMMETKLKEIQGKLKVGFLYIVVGSEVTPIVTSVYR